MVIKVGINGFGRVGRVIFRTCLEHPDIQIAAINDPAIEVEYICYLIKFDSTHGTLKNNVAHSGNEIQIDELHIKVFRQKQPRSIPWHTAGVQYVLEASGMFTSLEKASGHLGCDGVKRVIITAPSVDVPMVILGVNEGKIKPELKVISCGSSTLYCLAPIVKVLEDNYGIEEGFITSIHAMTPSLKPLDGLCIRGKHWRDHRSITQNIIPAATGACRALGRIIPSVRDKVCGLAFRVPIANVSVLDFTVRLKKYTSLENIINDVKRYEKSIKQTVITASNEEAVSSDFIGDSHSCILDIGSSIQLKPNSFKLICWYENEYSYACRVVDLILFSELQLHKHKTTYIRSKLFKKPDNDQKTESIAGQTISLQNSLEDRKKIKVAISPKPTQRPMLLKRALFQSQIPYLRRDYKTIERVKTTDNDDGHTTHTVTPQLLPSQANVDLLSTLTPLNSRVDCFKAQERLEEVKKEFTKMVSITKDLLRKSNNDKRRLCIDPVKENVASISDVKTNNTPSRSMTSKGVEVQNPKEASLNIFDVSGDGKNNIYDTVYTINSKNNSTSKEEVESLPYDRNLSDYSMSFNRTELSGYSGSLKDTREAKLLVNKRSTLNSNTDKVSGILYKQDLSDCSMTIFRNTLPTPVDSGSFKDASETMALANNENKYNYSEEESQFLPYEQKPSDYSISITRNDAPIRVPSKSFIYPKKELFNATVQHPATKDQDTTINSIIPKSSLISKTFTNIFDGISRNFPFQTSSKNRAEKEESVESTDASASVESNTKTTNKRDGIMEDNNSNIPQTDDGIRKANHDYSKGQIDSNNKTQIDDFKTQIDNNDKLNTDNSNKTQIDTSKTKVDNNKKTKNYDSKIQTSPIIKPEASIIATSFTTQQVLLVNVINRNLVSPIKYEPAKNNVSSNINPSNKTNEVKPDEETKSNGMDENGNGVNVVTEDCNRDDDSHKRELSYTSIPDSVPRTLALDESRCSNCSPAYREKQDIYDKLDSISVTPSGSDNSFEIERRKSQIINICDLTNSLEDIDRLDKICKIMEISDELSNKLFSALDEDPESATTKKWSFKDLCEKIKLDEFCNNVFGNK